jgi:Bacterial protein of unknown function (DUF853)
MVSLFKPKMDGINLAVAVDFLRRIGVPQWHLIADGKPRVFTEKSADAGRQWMTAAAAGGKPIMTVLPTFEGGVWFLVGRMPLTASPAALKPAPQLAVAANDWTLLWRLAEPVKPDVAAALALRLLPPGGKAAIGEPIPVPGTLLPVKVGLGMVQRYPVRMLAPAATPGYRVQNGQLIDVRKPVEKVKPDPRLMAVPLADDVAWQPGAQSNGFMLVLGASGSGKTESLKTIGAGIHRYGVPVLVLDFHGDVILPGVPTTALSSAPGSTIGLNPLEVDVASARENGLYDQRTAVLEMVRRAVPQLGHKQANALHTALEDAYAAAGIRDDDPASWTRPAPTFAQLMVDIEDEGLLAGVRGLFGHPIFDRKQHLGIEDMLKSSMRLDLSKLPEGVRYVTAETLLRRLFTALRMRGPIPVKPVDDGERFRLFIVIDEARLITMGGNSDIVTALVNEARKFGLGLVLASQMADHFPSDIRSNAASWIVLKPQTMSEAGKNAPNIGVDAAALMALKGRGDGFYRVGNAEARRVQVHALK